MTGTCLCGEVEFDIKGDIPGLYQCHCSLCRKATGSSANAATLVSKNNLTWLKGEKNITSYEKSTGFRSSFCRKCGSPLPNIVKDTDLYYVPAGLLENVEGLEVVVHIFTQSKAYWDDLPETAAQHESMTALELLSKLMHQS